MATMDNFIDIINKEIDNYAKDTLKGIEARLDETADKILEYLSSNTPRSGRTGALSR